MFWKYLAVAVTLLSFTACTTMQPMRDFTPSRIRHQVEPGQHVSIVAENGNTYDLVVTAVDDDSLTGTAPSGKAYRIHYEAIESIDVERTSGWQVGTGFGAVLTVGLIAFLLALIKGWDPGGGGESSSGGGGND